MHIANFGIAAILLAVSSAASSACPPAEQGAPLVLSNLVQALQGDSTDQDAFNAAYGMEGDTLEANAMILGDAFEIESYPWCLQDTAAVRLRLPDGDATNVLFVEVSPNQDLEVVALRRVPLVADAAPLGANEQAEILDAISARLTTHYVLPDVGQQMAQRLAELTAADRYDEITEREAFGLRITEDLRRVYPDKHLRIHGPQSYADRYALLFGPSDLDEAPDEDYDPVATQSEIELRTVTAGDQRVGYIGFDRIILDEPYATERLRTAVDQFADADGLIVDLRGTRGGDGNVTSILSNQLFATRTLLLGGGHMDVETSTWIDQPTYVAPDGTLPLIDVPLMVLINGRTASAAEAFAFAMQISGRGTLVGAQSAGAGHRVTMVELADGFGMDLPIGRSFDPATGDGWEGTGITPDIAVSSDQALPAAISALTGLELAEAPHQH